MYRLQNPRRNTGKTNGLTQATSHPYIGRFAPSPTGYLHLGSLYTALASYLDARSQQGRWVLRIDDLDIPRNVQGSVDQILKTLSAFALHWDGQVVYQSDHSQLYEDALNQLKKNHQVYACTCSRKDLSLLESRLDIYPGICRHKKPTLHGDYALRIKTEPGQIGFQDRLQGIILHQISTDHGDFIIRRKDRIIAYQFAVVIDDYIQQVSHVVRGVDLLASTPKQIYLQQLLGLDSPQYMHVPVIVDAQGYKLSKQTQAQAVQINQPGATLYYLLGLLKQNPPAELKQAPAEEILAWAIPNWDIQALTKLNRICTDAG